MSEMSEPPPPTPPRPPQSPPGPGGAMGEGAGTLTRLEAPRGGPLGPSPQGGGFPLAAVFVGGLAVVAGITWGVLTSRAKDPYGADGVGSPDPYEMPRVHGVERRKPRRGATPPVPAPAVATPGPAPAAQDTPPAPIFAPPGRPAEPGRPPLTRPTTPPEERATPPPVEEAAAPAAPPNSPSSPVPPPSSSASSAAGGPEAGATAPALDPSLPAVAVPSSPSTATPPPGGQGEAGGEAKPPLELRTSQAPPTEETGSAPAKKVEGPADWRLLVTGESAAEAAAEASRLAEDRRLVTKKGRIVHFSPGVGEAAGTPGGVRFVVERRPSSLRLAEVRLPEPADDPIAALVPPAGLAPDVLVGLPLEVPAASQAAALGALALLLSGDGPSAVSLLDPKPTAPGLRVLLAYALLLQGELPKVHDVLFGLGDDPVLGAVVRFLTGAALLSDRNPREAIRDFQAALRAKPAFWPARLLEAESHARLDLPEEAAKGFEAVLAAVPDRPEALLSQVYYLAGKDRPAALAAVTRLVKARPDLVPAWWMLGWVRRQGDTSEDAAAEVKAFETVVFLRPRDPDAWRELGTAELRWADVAGGLDARRAAAAAFAEQAALQPKDGLAWFNRGSVLHQLATDVPLAGDAEAFAQRLAEVRSCYAKALDAGTLAKSDAARVHHNVGLVIDLLPSASSGAKAVDAFQAAVDADRTYAQGALALAAARVASRDGAAATKVLAAAPSDADPVEKGVLTAAARWVSGDEPGAAAALQGSGESPKTSGDVALRVLRGLVVTGYRRAALTLLEGQPADAPRLLLRVRARAGLRDVTGLRADLLALSRLDARLAEQLRARDSEVLATLGPAATRGTPEERLR